jgi:hypothetical protein
LLPVIFYELISAEFNKDSVNVQERVGRLDHLPSAYENQFIISVADANAIQILLFPKVNDS